MIARIPGARPARWKSPAVFCVGSGETETLDLAEAAERCWSHVGTPEAFLSVEAAPRIRAHEGRLQQLLENLFRNAVEHGGEEVTVTVGALKGGFFVEDDGPGIPEGKREKVLETGYSTTEEGTGLGLSIAGAVADSHGWSLSAADGREGEPALKSETWMSGNTEKLDWESKDG